MFAFLRLLNLLCVSVAVVIVNLLFSDSDSVSFVVVHRSVNVWISMGSGFTLCVFGHCHHKSFVLLVLIASHFSGVHRFVNMFGFLRLLNLLCVSGCP